VHHDRIPPVPGRHLPWPGRRGTTSTTTTATTSTTTTTTTTLASGWHNPTINDNINPGDTGLASRPQVAVDDDGNACIVWTDYYNGTRRIYRSEYRDATWDHPTSLADYISPGDTAADKPTVAISLAGVGVIAWEQVSDTGDRHIFISTYASGTWTDPDTTADCISSDSGYTAKEPVAAVDDNGNMIVTWSQDVGSEYDIFKSEYRSGAWTHPTGPGDAINPDTIDNAIHPQVAMDNGGTAIIVWEQTDGSDNNIYKSEYRTGTWTHPADFDAHINPDQASTNFCAEPMVASNAAGRAGIVWMQMDDAFEWRIYYSEYDGGWTHPGTIGTFISASDENAFAPRIKIAHNGHVVIIWEQWTAASEYLYIRDHRGFWNVNSVNLSGSDVELPRIAINDTGETIVTWYGRDTAGNDQVFQSRYTSSAWTHPADRDDNISPDWYDCTFADAGIDNSGGVIITWLENNAIYYGRYVP
jgi:hypothetical protein